MTTELRRDPYYPSNFLLVRDGHIVGNIMVGRDEYNLGGGWAPPADHWYPRELRGLDAAGCLRAGCGRVGIRLEDVTAADDEACERVVAAAKMRRVA